LRFFERKGKKGKERKGKERKREEKRGRGKDLPMIPAFFL